MFKQFGAFAVVATVFSIAVNLAFLGAAVWVVLWMLRHFGVIG